MELLLSALMLQCSNELDQGHGKLDKVAGGFSVEDRGGSREVHSERMVGREFCHGYPRICISIDVQHQTEARELPAQQRMLECHSKADLQPAIASEVRPPLECLRL